MNIKNYRLLAVLGPPFIGINHLTNLVSTSPGIQCRIPVPDYRKYLSDFYLGIDNPVGQSHVQQFLNMNPEDWTQARALVESSQLTTVLPDHVENAYWVMSKLRDLGPQTAITFEIYDSSVLECLNPARQAELNKYNPYLYRFLYQHDVVSRLLDLPLADVFPINLEHYFTANAKHLLKDVSDVYALDLDIEFCSELHKIWYKNLTKK